MAFGLDEGLALAGGLGSYFTGKSAANAQKEAMRRQAQLIGKQSSVYGMTAPFYQQLLQQAAGNLNGYGGPGSAAQMLGYNQAGSLGTPQPYQGSGSLGAPQPYQGSGSLTPGHQMAVQDPVTGHYHDPYQPTPQQSYGGLNPEDNLRLKGAEEDINRFAQHNANQLRFNANLSGLNSGAVGAGLARNENDALKQYAQFRRGLAIQAPEMQQQRLANFANLLSPGFGQGAAASAGYGQQGGIYGQQASQGFAGVGQAIQNYQYQRALKNYGQNAQGIPTGGKTQMSGGGGYYG